MRTRWHLAVMETRAKGESFSGSAAATLFPARGGTIADDRCKLLSGPAGDYLNWSRKVGTAQGKTLNPTPRLIERSGSGTPKTPSWTKQTRGRDMATGESKTGTRNVAMAL